MDYVEGLLDRAIQDITPADLRTFKRDTTLRRETLKGIIVAVKQFHSWGVLEGLWPDSGLGLVRTPTINDTTSTEALSRDNVVRLLDECRRPLEYRLIYLGPKGLNVLVAHQRLAVERAVDACLALMRMRPIGIKIPATPNRMAASRDGSGASSVPTRAPRR